MFKSTRDGLSYEGKLYVLPFLWRKFDTDVAEGLDGRKGYRNRRGRMARGMQSASFSGFSRADNPALPNKEPHYRVL
jgi:hypothetical protein